MTGARRPPLRLRRDQLIIIVCGAEVRRQPLRDVLVPASATLAALGGWGSGCDHGSYCPIWCNCDQRSCMSISWTATHATLAIITEVCGVGLVGAWLPAALGAGVRGSAIDRGAAASDDKVL